MCGICGFITKKNISPDELRVMNDTMTHRGPDDSGTEIFDAGGGFSAGFAQRRLAIRDLSPLGHQPMHSSDGSVSIVYNGEIYNTAELMEELTAYPFRSTCDTEVILAAYLEWGVDFLEHLSGMFAFALYDRKDSVFILARDRAGKKPLYYLDDGESFVFASEMKPIMAWPGFRRDIDRRVIPRYLFQQYINSPESIFRDVYKLMPGEMLTIRIGRGSRLRPEKKKYWDIAERYGELSKEPVTDYAEGREELKRLLLKAVSERMISDVPLGLFLSGGYDSSLMTAMAVAQSGGEPVKTYSVGFSEKDFDESECAKAVAEHLGTRHTTRVIDENDMFALVESLPYYFDEPFADPSQIPTMLVSETARQGVTVALSGDGGDEFFCGYNIYDNVAQAQRLDVLGAAANLAGKLPLGGGKKLADKYPFKVRVVSDNRDRQTKTQIASMGYIDAAMAFVTGGRPQDDKKHALSYQPLSIKYPIEDRYPTDDWQVMRMLLDMDTYLPEDILCKVDRASMKYSLEARCPILDQAVMEYSFRLPQSFKYRDGIKKYILKDITYDYIPRELLDRPKQGFGAPTDKWLRGPLQKELLDYAGVKYLKDQGIFDPEYVSKFVTDYLLQGDAGPATGKNYSKLVWSFFVFQKWEKVWCRGR